MPQAYRDAYNDYIVTVTGNRTEDRWIECINGMQAVLAMPLGLLFVDAAFDERSKTVVRELNRGTCNFANSMLNHSSFKLCLCQWKSVGLFKTLKKLGALRRCGNQTRKFGIKRIEKCTFTTLRRLQRWRFKRLKRSSLALSKC